MKRSPSEQQELLLLKACKQNGQFSMGLAESLYSSRNAAKNAVTKLEVLGFIENTAPGFFKVVKVTQDVKEEFESEENSSEVGDDVENNSDSYETEEIKAV